MLSIYKFIDSVVQIIIRLIQITIVLLLIGIGFNYFNKFYKYSNKKKILSIVIITVLAFVLLLIYLYNGAPYTDLTLKSTLALLKSNEKAISITFGILIGSYIIGFFIISIAKLLIDKKENLDPETKYYLVPLYATVISIVIIILGLCASYIYKNEIIFQVCFGLILGPIILGLNGVIYDFLLLSNIDEEE
jgi:hypothetical protein